MNEPNTQYDDLYKKGWGHNYSVQPLRAMRYHFVKRALRPVMVTFEIKRALDVGCGTGEIAKFILGCTDDIKVTGIDVSGTAIGLAGKNCPNATFCTSDLASHEADNKYDLITAVDVIEHIEDDVSALCKVAYLLRVDGIVVLSLPNSMRYWTRNDRLGGHYRRYSKAEIVQKLSQAGFNILTIRSYGFPFAVPYLYLKVMLGKTWECEDRVAESPGIIARCLTPVLRRAFLFNVDIGWGLHLLVVAQKVQTT